MSKYESLRSEFAASWEAHDKYWTDLERLVGGIRDAFAAYLGISPKDMVTIRGQSVPALCYGKIVDGQFTGCGLSELERSHDRLNFVLMLSFSHDKLALPRSNQITFNLSVGCEEGSYNVQEGSNIFDPVSFKVPPFAELFDHLLSSVKA